MTVVERITPTVARIELPLPLEGLTSVNCFVLLGDKEIALVDPGWSSPETDRALRTGLDELGLTASDISRALVTHHHWDHYTQAIAWQRTHAVPVHLGKGEDPNVVAWLTLGGVFPRQVPLLERAGAPDLARTVAELPVDPDLPSMDFEPPAAWISDDDIIDLGGVVVRALATPGHTRGHLCFEIVGENMLLTGDHVLPRITPSIAFEREPDPEPLVNYLASLRLITELPDARLLPAHGSLGPSAARRAAELLAHHDERLAVIHRHVDDGQATAYEVAAAMLWTRRKLPLSDLDPRNRMMAVLEVAAHLTLLEAEGRVDRNRTSDVDEFTAR